MGLNEILILLVHDESPYNFWLQAAEASPLPWEQKRKYGCGVPDRLRTVLPLLRTGKEGGNS